MTARSQLLYQLTAAQYGQEQGSSDMDIYTYNLSDVHRYTYTYRTELTPSLVIYFFLPFLSFCDRLSPLLELNFN